MEYARYPQQPVLLIDDELQFLQSASFSLRSSGIDNVIKCQDSTDALTIVRDECVCVVACDMLMPKKTGKDVLAELHLQFPDVPVIMLTAVNDVETAVECIKNGAIDYLVKPVDKTRLVMSVKNALEFYNMRMENSRMRQYLLSDTLREPQAFSDIVTRSRSMQSIFGYVEAVAQTSMPVLVCGETGVGKEMIARSVHRASGRKGEFVQVNVAGLDDTLFSDTLFGHEKGAFTGADKPRVGLIAKAAGGTIFLDEIGDLSRESQVKLLRLLEDRAYYPLGSDMPVKTDAKVVVATNRDLAVCVRSNSFRSDLFYRLQTHHIQIPPLRDRKEDIPLLTDHFMEIVSQELDRKKPTPPPELYVLLSTYQFPGNVRELKSLIFDAVSRHHSGIMSMTSIKEKIGQQDVPVCENQENDGLKSCFLKLDKLPTIRDAEQLLVDEALSRSKGNQSIAAAMVGLTRSALNKRIHRGE